MCVCGLGCHLASERRIGIFSSSFSCSVSTSRASTVQWDKETSQFARFERLGRPCLLPVARLRNQAPGSWAARPLALMGSAAWGCFSLIHFHTHRCTSNRSTRPRGAETPTRTRIQSPAKAPTEPLDSIPHSPLLVANSHGELCNFANQSRYGGVEQTNTRRQWEQSAGSNGNEKIVCVCGCEPPVGSAT